MRRVIEREIDKPSQDNEAAANPEEQSHGALWIEPAIEMRRGGHQLLCEFVIANAEARARKAVMGKPERLSRMGRLDGGEARQTPCFDKHSFARENNA